FTPELIKPALERALHDEHRGLGTYSVSIDDQAIEHFARGCGGDVRSALNALELDVLSTKESADGVIHITLETAEEC
ncbi:recombinase RarA, partial [Bacillus spizizenii]|nr:recombinase RarA [Bacillus spizizenii]